MKLCLLTQPQSFGHRGRQCPAWTRRCSQQSFICLQYHSVLDTVEVEDKHGCKDEQITYLGYRTVWRARIYQRTMSWAFRDRESLDGKAESCLRAKHRLLGVLTHSMPQRLWPETC